MINNLVSCIIPTYKRSSTLIRAIQSVLSQTYVDIEILVVDDNIPNDEFSRELQQLILGLDNPRITYIQQEKHINGAAARNVGIKLSRGEYIAFLDDDDEWYPEKISKQINILNENPEISLVSCLYKVIKNDTVYRLSPSYTSDSIHRKILDRSVSIFTSTILIKKSALDFSINFNETLIRHQDLQFLLDFTLVNKISVVDQYLVKLHIDSSINRPKTLLLIKIKEDFFNVVNSHLSLYSKSDQKLIYAAHYFEIIFSSISSRNYFLAYKYMKKVGFNIRAYKALFKRYIGRLKNESN